MKVFVAQAAVLKGSNELVVSHGRRLPSSRAPSPWKPAPRRGRPTAVQSQIDDASPPPLPLSHALCLVCLDEPMARARVQVESVEFFQLTNACQRVGVKRAFPVKGVQHDSLEQI